MNRISCLAPAVLAATIAIASVPLVPTSSAAGPWRLETVDTTVSNRIATSIAIDSQGWPRVAYCDTGPGAIYYAWRSAAGWASEFVDSTGAVSAGVNRSISLVLDGDDVPHIGYLARQDPTSHNCELRHAVRGSSGWTVQPIYAPGAVLDSPVLARDCAGGLRACVARIPGPILMYGDASGGAWSFSPAGSGQRGSYPSLRASCNGDVHVVFSYTNAPFGVGYGRRSAGVWTFDTLAVGAATYTSLQLDSHGDPHLTWYGGLGSLRYGVKAGGSWSLDTIAPSGGLSNSLALDSGDHAHVAYWEGTFNRLYYASDVSGQWIVERPESPQPYPVISTSLTLDAGGASHLSYGRSIGTHGALMYATTAPPTTAVEPPARPTARRIRLELAYPNPSSRGVDVVVALRGAAHLRLDVRDVMGRHVRRLADGLLQEGQTHLRWDGADARGRRAGAGVYWVVLEAEGTRDTRRIVLLDGR